MIVLPSDHYIENEKEFKETVLQGVEIANKKRGLVTIGVQPTRPETGYGYIEMGDRIYGDMPTFKVERFLEKPNTEVAKDLLLKGNFLWNSGMFVWRADALFTKMHFLVFKKKLSRFFHESAPTNSNLTFFVLPSQVIFFTIEEIKIFFSSCVAKSIIFENLKYDCTRASRFI